MITYSAIILAAGTGSRTGFNYNKIFHKINDKFIVEYSIDYFKNDPKCKQLLLICNENDFTVMKDLFTNVVDSIFIGGKTRQESVYKALNKADNGYLLIHDSARPFINSVNIEELLVEVDKSKASTLAIPVTNTIVEVNGNRLIKTLDRTSLLEVQTPQAFDRDILLNAHNKAIKAQYSATDDTDIVRQFTDIVPTYVMGDYRSIKLTTKDDIKFLEVIL
jgi:2-C-methyl-D-erythritol 4-phosphate cytidylyltransferase